MFWDVAHHYSSSLLSHPLRIPTFHPILWQLCYTDNLLVLWIYQRTPSRFGFFAWLLFTVPSLLVSSEKPFIISSNLDDASLNSLNSLTLATMVVPHHLALLVYIHLSSMKQWIPQVSKVCFTAWTYAAKCSINAEWMNKCSFYYYPCPVPHKQHAQQIDIHRHLERVINETGGSTNGLNELSLLRYFCHPKYYHSCLIMKLSDNCIQAAK